MFTAGFLFALLSGVLLSGGLCLRVLPEPVASRVRERRAPRGNTAAAVARTGHSGLGFTWDRPPDGGKKEEERRGDNSHHLEVFGVSFWCGTCLPMLACGTQRYREPAAPGRGLPV